MEKLLLFADFDFSLSDHSSWLNSVRGSNVSIKQSLRSIAQSRQSSIPNGVFSKKTTSSIVQDEQILESLKSLKRGSKAKDGSLHKYVVGALGGGTNGYGDQEKPKGVQEWDKYLVGGDR